MTKMFDVIMIGVEVSIIMYFYNIAINSPDMGLRLLSCAAMTMEIYFIRRHLKRIKISTKEAKK